VSPNVMLRRVAYCFRTASARAHRVITE
jgi:hypothetical protein